MNRREAIWGTVCGLFGFSSIKATETSKEITKRNVSGYWPKADSIPFTCPRFDRYKQYEKMLECGSIYYSLKEEVWDAHKSLKVPSSQFCLVYKILYYTALYGDAFYEKISHKGYPYALDGCKSLIHLPADSMFRIQTIKNEVVEFQQCKHGPDYSIIGKKVDNCKVIQFKPDEIFHVRWGDDIVGGYGISALEPIRLAQQKSEAVVRLPKCFGPQLYEFYIKDMIDFLEVG